MIGVVVSRIRMTVKAQRDRVFCRVSSPFRHRHDVMNFDLHALVSMTYTAMPRRSDQRIISNLRAKRHVSCLPRFVPDRPLGHIGLSVPGNEAE
jgi:hypothetical protein